MDTLPIKTRASAEQEIAQIITKHLQAMGLEDEELMAKCVKVICKGSKHLRPTPDREYVHKYMDFIQAVVEHFQDHGLTFEAYLAAACRQSQLFSQFPDDTQNKIKAVVEHFQDHGLTLEMYLAAACKQPPLFCQLPETIQHNIEAVVEHFQDRGLTLEMYLAAACKQPPLFCQRPATVIGKFYQLIDLYNKKFLSISKKYAEKEEGLPTLLHYLCLSNPILLTHASERYTLHAIHSGFADRAFEGSYKRSVMEQRLRGDMKDSTIPKIPDPLAHDETAQYDPDNTEHTQYAHNMMLRALAHAGMLKNGHMAPSDAPHVTLVGSVAISSRKIA